jgi:hypothetical protein
VQGRQHQMPGQRRLNRDLGGFQISDLADHHHIWVLAQHGTQNFGEAQPDLRLDLDLIDAVELLFDRVLDRRNFTVRRVEFQQRCVKAGRLAAAGRAGDDDDAMGTAQQFLKQGLGFFAETE